jgi:hypothetical protein
MPSHFHEDHEMPKKSTPGQATMPAILPPGPAEKAIAAAKERAKPAKNKLPKPSELQAMIERFKLHAQHVRDLLADVQAIAENKWPLADPDYENNLSETIATFLRPIDVDTRDVETLEVDVSLNALLIDVQSVLDDLQPGPDQGLWARAILEPDAPEKSTRVAGMPSKSRPKATK